MNQVNKMFETEKSFQAFIATLNCLDEENFPLCLNREDPMDLSIFDIKDFIERVKEETDLDVTIEFYTCDECGRLHMLIVIDEKEEREYGNLHLVQ